MKDLANLRPWLIFNWALLFGKAQTRGMLTTDISSMHFTIIIMQTLSSLNSFHLALPKTRSFFFLYFPGVLTESPSEIPILGCSLREGAKGRYGDIDFSGEQAAKGLHCPRGPWRGECFADSLGLAPRHCRRWRAGLVILHLCGS